MQGWHSLRCFLCCAGVDLGVLETDWNSIQDYFRNIQRCYCENIFGICRLIFSSLGCSALLGILLLFLYEWRFSRGWWWRFNYTTSETRFLGREDCPVQVFNNCGFHMGDRFSTPGSGWEGFNLKQWKVIPIFHSLLYSLQILWWILHTFVCKRFWSTWQF